MNKFDETHASTLRYTDKGDLTYYLDQHLKNGEPFFTVSQDENLLYTFDSYSEALNQFNALV